MQQIDVLPIRKTGCAAIAALCLSALLLGGCASEKKIEAPADPAQIATTRVVSQVLDKRLTLPSEILPYQWVAVYPKVEGFISWIGVDRGSRVKQGDLLVKLIAPELEDQRRQAAAEKLEASSKLEQAIHDKDRAEAELGEAQEQLKIDQVVTQRFQQANSKPGVMAQTEVDMQVAKTQIDQRSVDSRKLVVASAEEAIAAARQAMQAALEKENHIAQLQNYLVIRAPFDGIVTERNMHEGAFAYPASGAAGYKPMLRIDQLSLLRIVVAVPQIAVSDIPLGTPVEFVVPSYPGKTFVGTVARVAHALDSSTRTMAVELNYPNPDWQLSPGTFAQVHWKMHRPYRTMFVPESAIATSLEKPFVIVVRGGVTHRVNIERGETSSNLVEIFGDVEPNDEVVLKASDDIADNTRVQTTSVASDGKLDMARSH